MMWGWDEPKYAYLSTHRNHREARDYTLEERLEVYSDYPKDGWEKREDGREGWQRLIPQEDRHGSCGLANLNVNVEGP